MKLIDKRLADLRAAQKNGTYTKCPRCGRDTMKRELYTNALSRVADIMVCDTCGIDEAKLAFMNAPRSLYTWHAFRPDCPESDFKALPAAKVRERIEDEQMQKLCGFFDQSIRGGDPEEIRLEAFESLPGLTQLWVDPFMANYRAADGTVNIRFRAGEYGIETCVTIIRGK